MYSPLKRIKGVLVFALCLTFFSSNGAPAAPKKQWVLVIDAGHGGKDPGCHGRRYKEKDIALAVALKFGHYIEQNDPDVKVIYTRQTDTFVPLNERAEIANRNHADLFICIHCNANKNTDAAGAATYVMGLAKSNGNLEVSKRENASILYEKNYKQTYDGFDPNSDEATVLFAMYQNVHLQESVNLSTLIQDEYAKRINRTDNGVKQAGFLVLWRTAMPSILTEIGFLTNRDEERKIGSQKGEDQIAEAIFLAFEQYKAGKDKAAYNPKSYNLAPLVLKKNMDTISTFAENDTATSNQVAGADTAAKNNNTAATVSSADTKTSPAIVVSAKSDTAHIDSGAIKVKKMQEAVVNLQPSPPVIPHPITALPKTDTLVEQHKKGVESKQGTLAVHVANTNDSGADKIVYKVQFLVSSSQLSDNDKRFANVPQVGMYKDNNVYKYTSGQYNSLKDAAENQADLRKDGYKDAFVVTFRDGKRVFITKLSAK